ncbi:unnamed protein product (macronuclear) [Paramecium tetraurelia]|uniref:Enkurin domain-containing protein n=1 Tax=Paramecium tetraurelia TaxID=5888 RepID=A0DE59_PARTE|nr:uncharacterized protein GSPATT00016168001 [Paramecium tetraurelia]CAK81326.1 unnamed protein product [Paramecium tetraurelia]|eukprot:XP_001448723.1 hypothetical protein (macronuclear) [Paramecium tetraurelia strain d4-2]
MKTNSVHSIIVDKQPKYSHILNAQLFSGYLVRGKDHSKKLSNQLSPSDDQKLSSNLSTSQSYVNAMKALQDKIKSLETENQNLQTQINSHEFIKSSEIQERQVSSHGKLSENQQIRDVEQKLAEIEIEKDSMKEEYEQKIQQLQQNLINIALQSDQRYREQQETIQQLQFIYLFTHRSDQLELQLESNQNYRNKINSQNQAIQQEKQNNSNLEYILDQERRDGKCLIEKNERLLDEVSKLKEQLFEIRTYMNCYTTQYDEAKIQRLQEETTKYQIQIQELTGQVEQYKELNLKLKLELEHLKYELEKSEFKRVKKLSESHIQIDLLKQQLINLSSNSIIHTQSPRDTSKRSKLSTNIFNNKTQSVRNYRRINNDSNKKILDQPRNSMFNIQQELFKQPQNDLQSSAFSRQKTQEYNFLTQQKSDDRYNKGNSADERVQTDQLSANKQQKYFQAQQRIHHLNEQLKILNMKYEDIENEISQQIDLKIKQEKRQTLLQIINQIQEINKELNDLVTISKLAQQL